jgi:predicted aspartyl protease
VAVFNNKLKVWNPSDPSHEEEFDLLVDTGASYSWLSRSRLGALGIESTGRMQFRTIEGRVVEREIAPVFVRVNGRIGGDTVVLAEPGDAEVMGAHTLESLGLGADPVQKRLIPVVGFAVRASTLHARRQNGS